MTLVDIFVRYHVFVRNALAGLLALGSQVNKFVFSQKTCLPAALPSLKWGTHKQYGGGDWDITLPF